MNKTNIELKHFCSDFSKLRKVLTALGAKKEVVKRQVDYFFTVPQKRDSVSPRLKLRVENKKQSLIYYERPDFMKNSDTTSKVMLYEVRDSKLLPFLEQTFGVTAIVDKRREVWRKANTVFHLDTVKGVGSIFEIELQKKGRITEKDKKTFARYQQVLLPHLGEVVRGSNVDLVRGEGK